MRKNSAPEVVVNHADRTIRIDGRLHDDVSIPSYQRLQRVLISRGYSVWRKSAEEAVWYKYL